jgi:multiple RNA-binding domain-containing protein 1
LNTFHFNSRAFLEEQGVALDAFSKPPSSRSKIVILVKNLPAFTKIEEIRDMFAKHGELGRVVLPHNGVTAIVEFYEPTEARAAFRKLAYTKFHGTPLYLEWAPEGAFKEGPGPKPPKIEEVLSEEKEEQEAVEVEETLVDPEPNTTIFVKNLNFDTSDLALREHFGKIGQIYSATIATKKDSKRQGNF